MPLLTLLSLRRVTMAASIGMTLALPATAAPQQLPSADTDAGAASPLADQDPPSISPPSTTPPPRDLPPRDLPLLTPPPADVERDPAPGAGGSSGGDSRRIRERIQEALRGQKAGAAAATGDPILDDVIDVIRSQGSVLDGTVLDEKTDAALAPGASGGGTTLSDASEQRYRVAESLLRTARLLAAMPDPDRQRQALVRQMRAEAARCLSGP